MTICTNFRTLAALGCSAIVSLTAAADPTGFDVAPHQGALLWSEEAITVRGTWIAVAAYDWPFVDKSNATAIECYREAMRCLESRAGLGRAKGMPPTSLPRLLPLALFYDIQSWSDGVVVASRANSRLEIDAKGGSVKLTWTQDPNSAAYFVPGRQEFAVPIENKYQTRFQGSTTWWAPYAKP